MPDDIDLETEPVADLSTEGESAEELTPEDQYQRDIDEEESLASFLPEAPDSATKAKESAPNLRLTGVEDAAAAPKVAKEPAGDAADEILSADDMTVLNEELGKGPATVIGKLMGAIRSRDTIIKELTEKVGGVSKYGDLLGEVEKVRPMFNDLGRVAARESKAFFKDINRGLDEIAKAGGERLVGKNAGERKENWEKLQKWILPLYKKAEEYHAKAEAHGLDKSLGDCLVDAWAVHQRRSGKAPATEATGAAEPKPSAVSASARADAMREQARRSNPASQTQPARTSGKAVSPTDRAKQLTQWFVKQAG